jgi:hypothetical protein
LHSNPSVCCTNAQHDWSDTAQNQQMTMARGHCLLHATNKVRRRIAGLFMFATNMIDNASSRRRERRTAGGRIRKEEIDAHLVLGAQPSRRGHCSVVRVVHARCHQHITLPHCELPVKGSHVLQLVVEGFLLCRDPAAACMLAFVTSSCDNALANWHMWVLLHQQASALLGAMFHIQAPKSHNILNRTPGHAIACTPASPCS